MALTLDLYQRTPDQQGNVLVVLIHGLAEPDRTWVCEQTSWKDLLLSDPALHGVDVGVVKYDTALIGNRLLNRLGVGRLFGKTVGGGNFTRIETLSRELKREFDSEGVAAYQHVVLVGHSMGGLVGIRYLLEELQHEEPLKVRGYISLATPFNGSLIAVAQHVFGRMVPHNQIAQLVPNSEFQTETRNLWKRMKAQNKLESILFSFCYGTQDTIVYENDATPYVVDNEWKEVVPLPGDHSGVIEVNDHRSASYREVAKLVRRVLQQPEPDPDAGGTPSSRQGGGQSLSPDIEGGTQGAGPVALATTSKALVEHLERHGAKMERDLRRFPTDAQEPLALTMAAVRSKLTTMERGEFEAFLKKYRYPFATAHEEVAGLRELWELLTLIEYSYPEWRFEPTDICNLFFEENRWGHLIYSAQGQPMLEIVLEMADRLQRGPYATLLSRGDQPLFPHRLILENAKSTPRENVCEHCGQPYPFRNILMTCSEAEETGMFDGLAPNGYAGLEGVKVSCGDCIRNVRDGAQNAEEVRLKIRRVI